MYPACGKCMRFWMVTITLDLSVTFWKLSNKLTKWDLKDLKELFWATFTLYRQILVKNNLYCLLIYQISSKKQKQKPKSFCVSENILTQISVTINHMSSQRTFFVTIIQQVCMSANEIFWSEIKRWDKQLLHRRLIFNDCLPKFNTENFIWWVNKKETVFHITLRRVLYRGSHVLQILLKAVITQRQYLLPELNMKVRGGNFLKTIVVLRRQRV